MARSRPVTRRLAAAAVAASLLVGALPSIGLAQDQGVAQPDGVLPGEPAIGLVKVADGFVDPVNIADDGSGRLYVVERIGRIRIIEPDGTVPDRPFLDIQSSVKTDFLEQGLLGLAFAPDYADSGYLYVYYADYVTNGNLRIVQYQRSADDPDIADTSSARLIVEIPGDPYFNHNGGSIHFGPDGYLYYAVGDGGLAGDPYDNAQDRRTPFGKLHRIEVTPDGRNAYEIPTDNPFAVTGLPSTQSGDPSAYHPGAERTIWAWGLRNPWTFSFDRETGDLYIADVGQNAWEEIDVQAAGTPGGVNYGWDWLEASHCYPETLTECPRQQLGELPVAEYSHEAGDCSISGMGVYRSDEAESLQGIYFNSDFCSGSVYGLARDESGAWVYQRLLETSLLASGGGSDSAGNVYLISCSCQFGRDYDPFANPDGAVWKVVAADRVPDGAEVAPSDAPATPEPSEAPSPGPDATDQAPATEAPGTQAPGTEAPATDAPATDAPATGAPASEAPATEAPAPVSVTVSARDMFFEPRDITIPADTEVTVDLRNDGAVVHDLYQPDLDVKTPDLQPGESGSVVIDLPPGTYEFWCAIPGHREAGMTGTFIVE
ncbi:MAG: PQQ-dependent sugar dehydrogenase [Chloroflexi bacterium]|nr:PQQ-dependent sugar dehydrogenase [Chloroflexota bacterium]